MPPARPPPAACIGLCPPPPFEVRFAVRGVAEVPPRCRYLGVCNDSVAIIQAALREEVTMFPCIVTGRAKHKMSQLYKVRMHARLPIPPHASAVRSDVYACVRRSARSPTGMCSPHGACMHLSVATSVLPRIASTSSTTAATRALQEEGSGGVQEFTASQVCRS